MVRAASRLLVVAVLAAAQPPREGGPPMPVVVELFTSEGCSSCPPADALLRALTAEQNVPGALVIGLSLHVDYWDHQGWKDRFSSASLTDRQRSYQPRFNTDSIYTPQMVVDGGAELVGSDAGAARRAIERASAAPHGTVRLEVEPVAGDRVSMTITASDLPRGTTAPADIVVAITEDQLASEVKRGENQGRTLTHAAVVRQLKTVAEAETAGSTTARTVFALGREWRRDRLTIVAFVQERRGRAIVASTATALPAGR